MPIDPKETPNQKRARLRKAGAARSKERRRKAEEKADPWTQNIKPKNGKNKSQDEHPE